VDSEFDLCLNDTGLNPAETSHCITTVGKLFTTTMPSVAEGWLNQLTPGIAGTFVATLGRSLIHVGLGQLSLSSLIG